MAIAPVNKFINIAVPVAPGEQKLYEVPTGTSALVLYAQVANVGVGTYPTVTFIQRRLQRSTALERDVRVIKDVEIPPNDALILVDGRMVLEKTALVIDSLHIEGTQTGVTTICDVVYDEPTGIITATTMANHGFGVGDQVTLAGIAFTCPDNTAGITTNIFPDPQRSYIVDTIPNAHTFSSVIGSAKGYKHVYNPAVHRFIRAKQNALTRTTWDNGASKYTPTSGTYDGKTGIVKLEVKDKGLDIIQVNGSGITPTGAAYDGNVGILTITKNNHGFNDWDLVKFDDDALTFQCTMDGGVNKKTYPRYGHDPMSGVWKKVTYVDADNFEVFVGKTPFDFYNVTAALYDPAAGIATLTVGTHDVVAGVTSVRLATESIKFTCAQDDHVSAKAYPRASGEGGNSGTADLAYNTSVGVAATTETTISLEVGTATGNTGIHTFVEATKLQPTNASYNPSTGALQLTVANHIIQTGDGIKIDDGSITLSCDYGCQVGVASHRSYPRSTDPASGKWLIATRDNANQFTVNVGASPDTSTHHFKSATAGITRSVVKIGGAYTHTAVPNDFAANGVKKSTTKVGIVTESLIFSCSQDGFKTEHAYPRVGDPVVGLQTGPTEVDCNYISFYVGVSTAGGLVAPLQMEFLASILENSNA